ncbi:MAG: MATE family efflux transporter [Phycisphaeraceae bacterium]|nr:MAG: MATE family efflux transporter [Phycisphaeraceae bacterium]
MSTGLEKAKSPLGELLSVAGPTVATMTSYTLMTFTDKWLVSRLGAEYVGAQGNGGLAAWLPQSIAFGVFGVVSTFVSQNFGAGKPERGAAYAWNAVWLAVVASALLLPYALALPWIFSAAGMDAGQAVLAEEYGRVLLYGAFLNLSCRALSNFFYGMHKAWVVMVAGLSANAINLVASAVLVFGSGTPPEDLGAFGRWCAWIAGWLGIEGMGIAGSAWGTVLATGFELLIPAAVFLGPAYHRRYGTRTAWRWSWAHVKDLLRVGWPAGVMFGNEMVCWGFFMVYLVSHFGAEHASAGWIAHQYMSLSFMPAVGLSVAVTAIVGKHIGAGRHDVAAARAWLAMRVALAYMGTCGVLFVVFREPMVRLFVDSGTPEDVVERVVWLGSWMMVATAAFQVFDAGAMVISGALRGAGDTVFPGVATIVASWSIIVGGGLALIHLAPRLESLGAWIAAATYIMVLCVVLLLRFRSGRWRSIDLIGRGATPEGAGQSGMVTDGIV